MYLNKFSHWNFVYTYSIERQILGRNFCIPSVKVPREFLQTQPKYPSGRRLMCCEWYMHGWIRNQSDPRPCGVSQSCLGLKGRSIVFLWPLKRPPRQISSSSYFWIMWPKTLLCRRSLVGSRIRFLPNSRLKNWVVHFVCSPRNF